MIKGKGLDHTRPGGIGVWYSTKGEDGKVLLKGEETNYLETSPIEAGVVPPPDTSLLPHVRTVVRSMSTDMIKDIIKKQGSLPLRYGALQAHPRVSLLSAHRDAHLYVFPAWVIDMISQNPDIESLGEDLIGWWAKAEWQAGLVEKLGFKDNFIVSTDEINPETLSTTSTADAAKVVIPPILAYIHPSSSATNPDVPLIRRVDTAPLLISINLQLAKLEAIEAVGENASSRFAHKKKIAHPEGIASRTKVCGDSLVAENVIIGEKCDIKESVIGAMSEIKEGCKLSKCVLMDGVVIGKGCKLTGCIVGRGSVIGDGCVLTDCEIQELLKVDANSERTADTLVSSVAIG